MSCVWYMGLCSGLSEISYVQSLHVEVSKSKTVLVHG